MSFRKRNVVVQSPGSQPLSSSAAILAKTSIPGIRPSPLDGRPTTSTGTRSLDSLLAGHNGLPLGHSVLIEENGTTDFAGTLLRYYAAEGVVQNHHVHVLGVPEAWARELPGLTDKTSDKDAIASNSSGSSDRMKIAWRYERLGEFGRERSLPSKSSISSLDVGDVFCHDFDLSRRLAIPIPSAIRCTPLSPVQLRRETSKIDPSSLLTDFLHKLSSHLETTPSSSIHRLVIPSLLSPTMYATNTARPEVILRFLHTIRSLLRMHPTRLTAMMSLPLSLHPRSTGLTTWMELLCDGVLEIAAFPSDSSHMFSTMSLKDAKEETPQGMFVIHRLPVYHERGGGGGETTGDGQDLSFTLSRRRGLVIKPYSLPPVEGDIAAQEGSLSTDGGGKPTKVDMEF